MLPDPSEVVEESEPELLDPEVSEDVPLVSLLESVPCSVPVWSPWVVDVELWSLSPVVDELLLLLVLACSPFALEFDEPEPPSLPPSREVSDSPPPEPPVTDFEISEVPGEMSASVRFSAMTTPPRPMPKAATPIATG